MRKGCLLALALLCLLTACAAPAVPERTEPEVPADEPRLEDITGPWQTEPAEQAGDTPLRLEPAACGDLLRLLLDWRVDYLHPELFPVEEARAYLEAHPRAPVTEHTFSGFLRDGRVDEEALFRSVKERSPIYRKQSKNYMYQLIYDDEDYRQIVGMIAEQLNADLPGKTEAELAELDCVLGELTVFYITGLEPAMVTRDNAMLINPGAIDAVATATGAARAFRNTVYHEACHLEQVDCIDRADGPWDQQGISISIPTLPNNPFRWSWTAEDGAELGSTRQSGDPALSYRHMISFLTSLDLVSLPGTYSTDGRDLERATLTRRTEDFYRLMGPELPRDELVKMMYAIEITQRRKKDYDLIYQDVYGHALSDEQFAADNLVYRANALEEMARIGFRNLTDALLRTEDAALEDVFCLMTILEADMNGHIGYSGGKVRDAAETRVFLRRFFTLQEAFLSVVSVSSGREPDELWEDYASYRLFLSDGGLNAPLRWLNPDQVRWLTELAGELRRKYTKPVWQLLRDDMELPAAG